MTAGVNGTTRSPDGQATPPGDYPSWDDYMHAFEAHTAAQFDNNARHIDKAMRLAPNLTVFRALLEGQPVPRSQLDQSWLRRYE